MDFCIRVYRISSLVIMQLRSERSTEQTRDKYQEREEGEEGVEDSLVPIEFYLNSRSQFIIAMHTICLSFSYG